jgi:RNA polymerase sigma factor (sigma-70 family)
MANNISPDDLQRRYLAALDSGATWFEIWRLLLGDDWFLAELKKHAESVVYASGHSPQLADDVQQEVIVNLSTRLKKSVYFGLDPAATIEKFANWIGTLLLNECRDALRRLHLGHEAPSPEGSVEVTSVKLQDQVQALRVAIDELPPLQSAVLRLFLAGHSLRSIAKQLKLHYKRVYLAFCSGVNQLRIDLN